MKKKLSLPFAFLFLCLSWTTAKAQQISGTVTSAFDEPLPGANIVEKGTTNGVVSDFDGNYSITVSGPDAVLVFSSIGFATQEVPVGNQTTLNVILAEDTQALDEVVLVGYGTQRRGDLTGAISSVQSSDLASQPVQSIDQALQGRAAGVRVVQGNGAPGTNAQIRIRGTNSILGGNDPLIIVDGFATVGGLGSINPQDIENIEVLKDAASTAIYGARATNGVVLVTTKKGKKGDATIDFSAYTGFQTLIRKVDMMNAAQFMSLANELAVNDGSPLPFPDPSAVTTDTDWQDELYRTGPIQNYNLTLSGGNDILTYSTSGNLFIQEGILKGTDNTLGSFRAQVNLKAKSWLEFSNSLVITSETTNERSQGNANANSVTGAILGAPPTLAPLNDDGSFNDDLAPYFFSPPLILNPLSNTIADNLLNRRRENRLLNNLYGIIKFSDKLSFKSSIGLDYVHEKRDEFNPRTIEPGLPAGNGLVRSQESYSILNENTLSYIESFDKHSIDAFAGYTVQTFNRNFQEVSSNGFVTDELTTNDLGGGANVDPPQTGGTYWGIESWLGRINYSFDSKYLISLSGRADGSSRFAEGNKWAFFPSIGLGWKIKEEKFLKESDVISNLKVRASWGQTGNQAIDPFQTFSRVSSETVAIADALQVGFVPDNLSNPGLKWEVTSQYNFGVDIGFFNERLRLTADYYQKTTEDLLAVVLLPPSVGFRDITQNIGSTENKGLEFNVFADILTGDFKWDINLNVWGNRNKVLELNNGNDIFVGGVSNVPGHNIFREGEELGAFFGYVQDGLTDTGTFAYRDLNGDGELDDVNDRTIIGSPWPDYEFGVQSNFSYKSFDLSIFVDGAQGVDIISANKEPFATSMFRGFNNLAEVYFDHWSPDNPDPNAEYPIASAFQDIRPSTFFIEDGSYIKIRNITLGCTLPVNRFNMSWLKKARIYVNLNNFFVFTKYDFFDPEANRFTGNNLRIGWDVNTYPTARTATIGIDIGL